MTTHRANGRRSSAGFTLVEVLVVAVVIGIVAGIAIPSLTQAIDRAAAARVVSDARTVNLAVNSFLEAGGTLPGNGQWGTAPPALNAYLQENMTFAFRDAEYRFTAQPNVGRAQLRVRYPVGSRLGDALQRYRRPGEVSWTPTRTTFFLVK